MIGMLLVDSGLSTTDKGLSLDLVQSLCESLALES